MLEPCQPVIDALPTGGDEIDEEREVVDACVALRERIALDPLEPAEYLIHQPADFGEMPGDGTSLCRDAVANRVADLARKRRLELGRGGSELLQPGPRALEHRLEVGGMRSPFGRAREPLHRPLDRVVIHCGQG